MKQNKLRQFINDSGVFNVAALCKVAGTNRAHVHNYLSANVQLPDHEYNALVAVMRKFGFKNATTLQK